MLIEFFRLTAYLLSYLNAYTYTWAHTPIASFPYDGTEVLYKTP